MNRGVLAACFSAIVFAANAPSNSKPSWNRPAAARYLDQRQAWWMAWPPAARDQGTFCISCHTALPYALARPALGAAPEAEHELRDNVAKRVRLWNAVQPYYSGQALQSRGTEAVLNALVLSSMDAAQGRLSDDGRAAFDHLWALQESSGAWPWINFRNEPWEAIDSPFYGACLAAIAVGTAPENYRASAQIRGKLSLLSAYLVREYPKQPLIHQVFLLWASAKLPGLLSPQQRTSIVNDLLGEQRSDGGWSVSSLAWSWRGTSPKTFYKLWVRSDESPFHAQSDGLGTGLVAFALEQSGYPRQDVHLQRGLAWLIRNQNADGAWRAYSLNTHRDLSPGPGLFMSDAATAFSILALTSAN